MAVARVEAPGQQSSYKVHRSSQKEPNPSQGTTAGGPLRHNSMDGQQSSKAVHRSSQKAPEWRGAAAAESLAREWGRGWWSDDAALTKHNTHMLACLSAYPTQSLFPLPTLAIFLDVWAAAVVQGAQVVAKAAKSVAGDNSRGSTEAQLDGRAAAFKGRAQVVALKKKHPNGVPSPPQNPSHEIGGEAGGATMPH